MGTPSNDYWGNYFRDVPSDSATPEPRSLDPLNDLIQSLPDLNPQAASGRVFLRGTFYRLIQSSNKSYDKIKEDIWAIQRGEDRLDRYTAALLAQEE